ncbi:phenylacetic acid degradation protein PaaN [Streptomyces sp. NPDC004435]|uniref:phenylacetic acid degradation protein PaaN n=1 Tax=Streptomyces sp. NPDC004435 TaxID=3364701 RepID=UPI0036C8E1BA
MMERHLPLVEQAMEALSGRTHWSPYPDDHAAHAQNAPEGERDFRELLGRPFALDQPGRDGTVGPAPGQGGETSPYGFPLDIAYPHSDPGRLLTAMETAMAPWRTATPAERAAVCGEILDRIHARSQVFAQAAAHTSGHGPVMALHAGAVHAQDRGLEAVALAYAEQTRFPERVAWRRPLGQDGVFALDKTFRIVPSGIGLVVAGAVFPAWNGYAGLFASLACGNAVLVKPHPSAVLPLALTVRVAREVLREAGFPPDVVCLAAEHPGEGLAARLALDPRIRIVDYTGGAEFGRWLTEHATQARVFTAGSAVNSLLVESTAGYRDMLANLAFSLALYSGQLCTSPQNLLIPRTGITTDEGHKGYNDIVADLGTALDTLLADDAHAADILGALHRPGLLDLVARADSGRLGTVAHRSRAVRHPRHPDATIRTPALVCLDAARAADVETLLTEWPGPVAFAVAVDGADAGVELLARTVRESGALSVGAYTTSPRVEAALAEVCADSGVMLSLNLTGDWYISQSAVYSDPHGSGLNPSGNTAYGTAAFVTPRFSVVAVRRRV